MSISIVELSRREAQLRWCYAIFSALQKSKHLLPSVRFTLRQTVGNLSLNFAGSDKFIQWILLIQSIDIEYIKEKNISLMPSLDYDFRRCTISPRPDIICLGEEFTVPDDGTVS